MAGEEFGTGSSRDWAAKGTDLLGIRATIGQRDERIYRDNVAEDDTGETTEFDVTAQVGTPAAVEYVENGGALYLVLRRLLTG